MTALPNLSDFSKATPCPHHSTSALKVTVTDHYWGFEVSPDRSWFDIYDVIRFFAGVIAIFTLVLIAMVWTRPDIFSVQNSFAGHVILTGVFAYVFWAFAKICTRGSRVRVQIDTAAGEILEVVDGLWGNDVVLARYGIDTVNGVRVQMSDKDAAYGQIQLLLSSNGPVPVAEGPLIELGPLRGRLAADLGVDPRI